MEKVLFNNVLRKSFTEAVKSIMGLTVRTIQNSPTQDDQTPEFQSYIDQLIQDCKDTLNGNIASEKEQTQVLNDLGTRYLDLLVHCPLAFFEEEEEEYEVSQKARIERLEAAVAVLSAASCKKEKGEGVVLSKCGACKSVKYCSRDCQRVPSSCS